MPQTGVGPPPVLEVRDKEQVFPAQGPEAEHSDGCQPRDALPKAAVWQRRSRSPHERSLPTGVLYRSWQDVPDQPPSGLQQGSVFVEIFSGKAGFTRALRKSGWLVLPPIDIVVEGDVLCSADILDQLF